MRMDETATLCKALQDGEAPDGLRDAICTRKGANAFFKEFFAGEDWTCADADPLPSALTDSLRDVPEEVLEVMLLSVIQGAAAESERKTERAIRLVTAMWSESVMLRQSCTALKDAVDSKATGTPLKMAEDASEGNEETIRSMWSNLLGFMPFEVEDYERASKALAKCGTGEEAFMKFE